MLRELFKLHKQSIERFLEEGMFIKNQVFTFVGSETYNFHFSTISK